ncbi:molybdopterin-dependent oxidoreductase [Sulfobacillus harzensis]|uniref:Molybdopterin-dependent oxidoreductase n=1 Tax=Sulfobacillus harzensis TaxID=2729629 RepID=A0A7Y0LAM3_9FIRM|nr:molybdopterin-dependent oxidoreductase [Sulfobacillus harzensis]NMP24924.1 molybdopterin-dependent oxidoreductase [Sulfobacillus harzensis]
MITGLIERPIEVPPRGGLLSRIDRVEDFRCLEGWVRPNQAWSGFRLGELIHLARPLSNARFVEVACGDFVAVLPLSDLEHSEVLLADTQNGLKLTASTGGPWRFQERRSANGGGRRSRRNRPYASVGAHQRITHR